MAGARYPTPSARVRRQLTRIEPSRHGDLEHRPCRVTLDDGSERDFVVVADAARYIAYWGVWPEDDRWKRWVPIERVVSVEESERRLPARLANELYAAGESGMGYGAFTIVVRDGRRLPFVTGNLVDFPALPPDVTTADVVDVVPHLGIEAFRARSPRPDETSAEYAWCLYTAWSGDECR